MYEKYQIIVDFIEFLDKLKKTNKKGQNEQKTTG
tara:strand:+ start:478 stop:579 length:102 start_codon:yes stop_codon:yes gene_type:complete